MEPYIVYFTGGSVAEPLILEVRGVTPDRALQFARERLARYADYSRVAVWRGGVLLFTEKREVSA